MRNLKNMQPHQKQAKVSSNPLVRECTARTSDLHMKKINAMWDVGTLSFLSNTVLPKHTDPSLNRTERICLCERWRLPLEELASLLPAAYSTACASNGLNTKTQCINAFSYGLLSKASAAKDSSWSRGARGRTCEVQLCEGGVGAQRVH